MNRLEKNPYTGTTPTEGMSDKERKTYIRRRIIEEFDSRKINCTVNDNRVQLKPHKTESQTAIAGVWFDLRQEFMTDEPATYWINYTFGMDCEDDMQSLRYQIYKQLYLKYSTLPFMKKKMAREKFLTAIENSYTETFDLCCKILCERSLFNMEPDRRGRPTRKF